MSELVKKIDKKIKTLENQIRTFTIEMESKVAAAEKLGKDSLKLELQYIEQGKGTPAGTKKLLFDQRELLQEVDHGKLLKLKLLAKLSGLVNDRNSAVREEIREQQRILYKKLNGASQALIIEMKRPLLLNKEIIEMKQELENIWKDHPDIIENRNYNFTSGSSWALKVCAHVFERELETGLPSPYTLSHFEATSKKI